MLNNYFRPYTHVQGVKNLLNYLMDIWLNYLFYLLNG